MTYRNISSQPKIATRLSMAAIALTMCVTAKAAAIQPTITFGDLTDPSGIALSGGVTVTGTGDFGAVACANPVISLVEVCTVSGTLPNNANVPFGLTVTNINIFEPNGTDVSDTLTITTVRAIPIGDVNVILPSTFTAVFTSDSGLPLTPLVGNLLGGEKLIENGRAIDAFNVGGVTFQVASDVSDVPEPSSVALLGAGMAGFSLLAGYRRKRAA